MTKEKQELLDKIAKLTANRAVPYQHKVYLLDKYNTMLSEMKDEVSAPAKKPKVKSTSEPSKPKTKIESITVKDASDEDCDELLKKDKERRLAAKERSDGPQKTEATKNKEKIQKVELSLEKRIEKGEVSQEELKKLLAEAKALIKLIEKYIK